MFIGAQPYRNSQAGMFLEFFPKVATALLELMQNCM
jgi:hypothetical protein